VDTGRLRQSITSAITGQRSVAVGTNTTYGKYHQFGTRNTPARPFLGFDKRAEREIEDIVRRYIVEGRT
jgi:HK97 gp10 family phage protein